MPSTGASHWLIVIATISVQYRPTTYAVCLWCKQSLGDTCRCICIHVEAMCFYDNNIVHTLIHKQRSKVEEKNFKMISGQIINNN